MEGQQLAEYQLHRFYSHVTGIVALDRQGNCLTGHEPSYGNVHDDTQRSGSATETAEGFLQLQLEGIFDAGIRIEIYRRDDREGHLNVLIELPRSIESNLDRVSHEAPFAFERRRESGRQRTGERVAVSSRLQIDFLAVLASQQVVLNLEVLLLAGEVGGGFILLSFLVGFRFGLAPFGFRLSGELYYNACEIK